MRWISPWHRVTCPFCFHRFHLSRAPRRVVLGATPVPDQAVGRFLGQPPPALGPVVHPEPGGFWKRLADAFLLPDDPPGHKRICPGCHLQLPTMLANGEVTGEVFAIIGPRNAGKSNF